MAIDGEKALRILRDAVNAFESPDSDPDSWPRWVREARAFIEAEDAKELPMAVRDTVRNFRAYIDTYWPNAPEHEKLARQIAVILANADEETAALALQEARDILRNGIALNSTRLAVVEQGSGVDE